MTFKHEQNIQVKVGAPLFTIDYLKGGKTELICIGKVTESESVGTAINEVFTESTKYDSEHTHVKLNGNFWIVANEDIKVLE